MRRAPAAAVLLLAALAGRPADAQPAPPAPEAFLTADGVRLQGLLHTSPKSAAQNGAVVVLLYPPGPGRDLRKGEWGGFVAHLTAAGFHVFQFDWRGHGGSTDIVDPLGDRLNPFTGFRVNAVTGEWNQKYVKRGADFKTAPNEIRVKGGITGPGYFPVYVNDLAAVHFHLDQLNDRGLVNTSSIYLVGAGDAATLGFLWLAAEWQRPADRPMLLAGLAYKYVPQPFAPMLGGPAGADVGGAVWLSASRPTVVPQGTLRGWVQGGNRLRDDNPMRFLYGDHDKVAAKDADLFFNQLLVAKGNKALNLPAVPATDKIGVGPTSLSGLNLLGHKDVNAEAWVVTYLAARQKGRAQAVARSRNYVVPYHIDPVAFGLRP